MACPSPHDIKGVGDRSRAHTSDQPTPKRYEERRFFLVGIAGQAGHHSLTQRLEEYKVEREVRNPGELREKEGRLG